jgi:hypothetical protein
MTVIMKMTVIFISKLPLEVSFDICNNVINEIGGTPGVKMEEQDNKGIPLVGMRVKEETPAKIILEWWNRPQLSLSNPLGNVISFFKGIFSKSRADSPEKESSRDDDIPEEIMTIDFDSRLATRVKVSRSGKTEQTDLDLKEVSQVRIQMEEVGHHFRLYLDSPNHVPFQVSIAFINSTYSEGILTAHARKIGELLGKPVVRQHTDMGNLISEEAIQA